AVTEAVGEPVPTEVRQAQLISTHLTRLLTEGTHGNPRQIKRFLNSMMLRQAIAEGRLKMDPSKIADGLLATLRELTQD
ncbi:hypothetical protein ABTF39_20655, partial [Acinetobacter baumannii]